ncbi:MAG TPA: phosphoglycerate mutase family protein [Gemmatimonadales bacterium]|nr:phosphoglycerate mutase family protein [Gemmatimonadales bacterium]
MLAAAPGALTAQQGGEPADASRALAPTTIILVRHAEKSVPLGDHPLSRQGHDRAKELARVLGSTRIHAIYATNYQRTQQTVRPTAERLGLPVTNLMTTAAYVTDLLDRIREDHVGETVLVASHRQTVPLIIEALGASPVPEITEEQYDHLYVLTITPDGRVTMSSLRYGRPTR